MLGCKVDPDYDIVSLNKTGKVLIPLLCTFDTSIVGLNFLTVNIMIKLNPSIASYLYEYALMIDSTFLAENSTYTDIRFKILKSAFPIVNSATIKVIGIRIFNAISKKWKAYDPMLSFRLMNSKYSVKIESENGCYYLK